MIGFYVLFAGFTPVGEAKVVHWIDPMAGRARPTAVIASPIVEEIIAVAAFLRQVNDDSARDRQYGRTPVYRSEMRRRTFSQFEFAALILSGVLGCGIAYWFRHRY